MSELSDIAVINALYERPAIPRPVDCAFVYLVEACINHGGHTLISIRDDPKSAVADADAYDWFEANEVSYPADRVIVVEFPRNVQCPPGAHFDWEVTIYERLPPPEFKEHQQREWDEMDREILGKHKEA